MNNLDDLRERVKRRRDEDQITLEQLAEAINISLSTVNRFLVNKKSIQYLTIQVFEKYANGEMNISVERRTFYLPKIRVTENVRNYFELEAKKNKTTLSTIINKYLVDVVENNYLVEEFGKHVIMTERAMGNVIDKMLVPYMKVINKNYDQVQIHMNFLAEIILQGTDATISDEDKVALYDQLANEYYRDKRKREGVVE